MSPNRSRSLREIFSEAAEIADPAARAEYLEQACHGDEELRKRTEALLAADAAAGPLPPPPSPTAPAEGFHPRIGRYELIEPIGEGGCGVVYLARQEAPIRRQVALKVIKLGMDTREVVARFDAERQALALMDHPHIARVLDAGATEAGKPYFVMEWVRGLKITEYCDRNRLTTRQRLELFIQACQAVQHAHQKGIIHRDLKPSNILVTELDGAPIPKVIDFGIAKAIEGRLTDQTLFTGFHQLIGTPAYMSPEQAALTAADIDTRSDIYSLGVLLYELLTGRTPFETHALMNAGLDAMRQTIREKEPPRPSTRLSSLADGELAIVAGARQCEPPRLVHLVRGDLDWIVMKCLAKERARRYETANGLAMDVRRYLGQEPVLARPPSRLYELQKNIRRNKLGFAATGAVLFALTAGLTLATLALRREQAARRSLAHQAYVEAMRVAQQDVRLGKVGDARERLRRQVPRAGDPDLRDWEWRQLAAECRDDPHFRLVGQTQRVSNARFLDNGRLLTTGRSQFRTFVWDVTSRQPLHVWTNHSGSGGPSDVLAVTPGGHGAFFRVAWGVGAVSWLDLDTGEEIQRVGALEDPAVVASLHVSPDGRLLAVAGERGAELWDARTRQKLAAVEGAAGIARFSPDSRILATSDASGGLRFWDVATRTWSKVIAHAHGNGVALARIRFSADGRQLVTTGDDESVRLRNATTLEFVREMAHPTHVSDLALSSDGHWLAVVGSDCDIILQDLANPSSNRRLRGHVDEVLSVDFSPDGRWLASSSRNGDVKLWSLEQPPAVPDFIRFQEPAPLTIAAPDGSGFVRVFLGSSKSADDIELWSAPDLHRLHRRSVGRIAGTEAMRAILLPGARQLAVGYEDGTLRLVGTLDDSDLRISTGPGGSILGLGVSLDGSHLASSSVRADDGRWIALWKLPTLERIASGWGRWGTDVGVSTAGRSLVSLDGHGGVEFRSLPALDEGPRLEPFATAENYAFAYSPDGTRLAVYCGDGTGWIFDVAAHRPLVRLPHLVQGRSNATLGFSHDGRRLAIGTWDAIKVLDAATAEEVWSVGLPDLKGLQVAFGADGETLLAVGSTGARVLRAPPLRDLDDAWLR